MWCPRTAKQNKANGIKHGGRIAFCHLLAPFLLSSAGWVGFKGSQGCLVQQIIAWFWHQSYDCLKIAFWEHLGCSPDFLLFPLQQKQRHPTLFNDCRAWPWDKEAKCDSKWKWLESLHLWWSSIGMEPKSRAPLIFKFHKKATSTAYWLRKRTLKTLGPIQ